MCLDTVYKENTKKRTGYKVMGNLKGCVQSYYYEATLPKGKWTKDWRTKDIPIKDGIRVRGLKHYPTGFHIFLTLEGARCCHSYHPVIKVKFRDVVATGSQGCYGDVAVAREIYIPKRIKDYRHD